MELVEPKANPSWISSWGTKVQKGTSWVSLRTDSVKEYEPDWWNLDPIDSLPRGNQCSFIKNYISSNVHCCLVVTRKRDRKMNESLKILEQVSNPLEFTNHNYHTLIFCLSRWNSQTTAIILLYFASAYEQLTVAYFFDF